MKVNGQARVGFVVFKGQDYERLTLLLIFRKAYRYNYTILTVFLTKLDEDWFTYTS